MARTTKHLSTNTEMLHYMNLVGVKPVDKDWRTSWPEVLRERVAMYCVWRHLSATTGTPPPARFVAKPQVLR